MLSDIIFIFIYWTTATLVHECGHLLAAKISNYYFKVEDFHAEIKSCFPFRGHTDSSLYSHFASKSGAFSATERTLIVINCLSGNLLECMYACLYIAIMLYFGCYKLAFSFIIPLIVFLCIYNRDSNSDWYRCKQIRKNNEFSLIDDKVISNDKLTTIKESLIFLSIAVGSNCVLYTILR